MNVNVIEIISGDTKNIKLNFVDENDLPVDLSGVSNIRFTVRDEYDNIIIQKSLSESNINITNALQGEAEIIIDASDTFNLMGVYKYDIEIEIGNSIITPVKSFFVIKEDITI